MEEAVFKKPANMPNYSCDCHMHVFGEPTRYPMVGGRSFTPEPAPLATYQAIQKSLGLTRVVLVQPSIYGLDNSCLLDTLQALGPNAARGVAAISEATPTADLHLMHDAGVRAVRFITMVGGGAGLESIEATARRIADLGWHIELYMPAEHWVSAFHMLSGLPVPVVIDHMARLPPNANEDNEAFRAVSRLLDTGNAWLKLCGYRLSKARPGYEDIRELGVGLLSNFPERCVWGTDWPHPNMAEPPGDAELLDLVSSWCPNAEVFEAVMARNPAQLYDWAGASGA